MNDDGQLPAEISRSKRIIFAILTISFSLILSIWIANTIFRKIQKRQKNNSLDYGDTVKTNGLGPGGLLKPDFDAMVRNAYGGTIRWKTNPQGFRRNQDTTAQPAPGALRILSLGDSFTAGLRIKQSDTLSALLEAWSSKHIGPTEVLISMIEHPYEGLIYLRQYGYKWSPHIVMLGITLGNDIAQSYVALNPTKIGFLHGLETLNMPDKCFIQANPVKQAITKKFYELTHSTILTHAFDLPEEISTWYKGNDSEKKLFDACNGLGMYIKDPPPEIRDAYSRLFKILSEYKAFCDKQHIQFVVLVFPQRFQTQPGDWKATCTDYGLNPASFDLMRPNSLIRNFCEKSSIVCIDPTEAMKQYHLVHKQNLYLPRGDMHWNRYGNLAWFRGARLAFKTLLQRTYADNVRQK